MAPHQKMTTNTSWLWNWAMGINPKSSDAKKKATFDFMVWATSKEYAKMSVDLDPTGLEHAACRAHLNLCFASLLQDSLCGDDRQGAQGHGLHQADH
ncbi:hypothetical protein EMGBD1_12950 [Anaerolineaceae bacterium]|nr:hypothetical protein EMGBD1_12950 [Anaerolineaceae bacterium]